MPRIRTIKPEFWTDGKIHKISSEAALFFIGLWNFCDDYGYFDCSSSELHLKMPRFRPNGVAKMLQSLEKAGLVRLCRGLTVGLVVSWKHQKIDKRGFSKWKDQEIKWDAPSDSSNIRDHSTQGEERRGKERIPVGRGGEIPASPDSTSLVQISGKVQESGQPDTRTAEFIAKYAECYRARYNCRPDLSGKRVGQIKTLVRGCESFPELLQLIEIYLQMKDPWFQTKNHDIGTFIENLGKIRIALANGVEFEDLVKKTEEDAKWAKVFGKQDLVS